MRKIHTAWTVGDNVYDMEIVEPNGNPGIYQIYINKYYKGVMMKRQGEWVGFFNGNDFGAEEITALGSMIDEEMK